MPSFKTIAPVTCLLLLAGCARSRETEKSIELVTPRTSGGIILKDSPADWAERWSEMLAEADRRRMVSEALASRKEDAGEEPMDAVPIPDAPTAARWPSDSGRIFDLPRLSATELSELMDAAVRRLQTDLGYDTAPPPEVASRVPALPEGPRAPVRRVRRNAG
jgi:hypothetical protein